MNKSHLKKAEGVRVQLRPVPRTRDGRPCDGDWVIREVNEDSLTIGEISMNYVKKLGLDHVYSFMTNPDRDVPGLRHGFLLLHVQLILDGNRVHLEPTPPPRSERADPFAHPHAFSPLIIDDGGRPRYFSWRGRDPLHLIPGEEPPRQLFDFAAPLCIRLRNDSGLEPQFNLADSVRGEIVYELSPDFRAKWRLLGGMGNQAGDQVLVLVPRR